MFAKGGNDTVNVGLFFPEVTIYGAAGNDVINVAAASSVAIEGGDGDDLLRARGETYDQVRRFFVGEDGTDTIEMAEQQRLDLTAVNADILCRSPRSRTSPTPRAPSSATR